VIWNVMPLGTAISIQANQENCKKHEDIEFQNG
jgi:hypothetical protein